MLNGPLAELDMLLNGPLADLHAQMYYSMAFS